MPCILIDPPIFLLRYEFPRRSLRSVLQWNLCGLLLQKGKKGRTVSKGRSRHCCNRQHARLFIFTYGRRDLKFLDHCSLRLFSNTKYARSIATVDPKSRQRKFVWKASPIALLLSRSLKLGTCSCCFLNQSDRRSFQRLSLLATADKRQKGAPVGVVCPTSRSFSTRGRRISAFSQGSLESWRAGSHSKVLQVKFKNIF